MTNATRTPPSANFFTYTIASSRTHDSRHCLGMADALPPHVEDLPPTYAVKAPEPVTLAMYLFKFGFLFPPFWIMGAWIFWLPLRVPSGNPGSENVGMAGKTAPERRRVIEETRKAE
ncbi:hypothetical protein H0H87_005946, partial [Tephrocybe sp. NHM501043]